jgi:hypothetical protein
METGVDRFLVTADDGVRPVVLMPKPALLLVEPAGVSATRSVIHAIELRQNYPNPFNPATWITFDLPEATHVALRIYDVSGSTVRTLVDRRLAGTIYRFEWDGRDDNGRELGSGVYYYRLEAGGTSTSSRAVLVK